MSTSYSAGRIGSIIYPAMIGWIAVEGSIGAGIITRALPYLVATLPPGILNRGQNARSHGIKKFWVCGTGNRGAFHSNNTLKQICNL